jgi:hypothetical protein
MRREGARRSTLVSLGIFSLRTLNSEEKELNQERHRVPPPRPPQEVSRTSMQKTKESHRHLQAVPWIRKSMYKKQ